MKAQMSAVPEGEAVEKPQPPKPASYVTHTEQAAAKVKASALRKADGFKLKITQAQAQLDHIEARRRLATGGFDRAANQYTLEIIDLRIRAHNLAARCKSTEGEIDRLQQKVQLLMVKSDRIMAARDGVTQDLATTGILLKAAQQKAKEVGLENQPKIDQLTKTRDKLIQRLYHHQILHPGVFAPEKAKTDA